MSTATQRLVDLMRRPINGADLARARWHLLDWYSCAVQGLNEPAGVRWAAALAAVGGVTSDRSDAPRFDPTDCGAASAAMGGESALRLSAALGNIGEMDDVHRCSVLHPGPVVIPAALAACQDQPITVETLLVAIIRGYESTIRVGEALGLGHYAYYHSTATAGVFGAASATASALALNDEQWMWALGNAGSVAGGLWQLRNENVDTKQWHNTQAATTGRQAALLAAQGISGPAAILEGPQGLLIASAAGGNIDALDQMSGSWLLHDCSFKPWPACRHVHPVIDAALQLGDRIDPKTTDRIVIETYADALTFCDRPRPKNSGDARFSLQYCAALCVLFGEVTLEDFAPDAWERPEVLAMMANVEVRAKDSFTNAYPQQFGARVRIEDVNSHHEIAVNDTLGDPERPLDRGTHCEKFRALLGLPDVQTAQAWVDNCFAVDLAADASELLQAVRARQAIPV